MHAPSSVSPLKPSLQSVGWGGLYTLVGFIGNNDYHIFTSTNVFMFLCFYVEFYHPWVYVTQTN